MKAEPVPGVDRPRRRVVVCRHIPHDGISRRPHQRSSAALSEHRPQAPSAARTASTTGPRPTPVPVWAPGPPLERARPGVPRAGRSARRPASRDGRPTAPRPDGGQRTPRRGRARRPPRRPRPRTEASMAGRGSPAAARCAQGAPREGGSAAGPQRAAGAGRRRPRGGACPARESARGLRRRAAAPGRQSARPGGLSRSSGAPAVTASPEGLSRRAAGPGA